jgi:hypothetical protein
MNTGWASEFNNALKHLEYTETLVLTLVETEGSTGQVREV